MSNKIGMCQACGDQGKTIMHDGGEYCLICAFMYGFETDDEAEDEGEE